MIGITSPRPMFIETQPRPNRSPEVERSLISAAHALEMGHANSGMICEHYRKLVKPKEAERYRNLRPTTKEKVVPLVTHA